MSLRISPSLNLRKGLGEKALLTFSVTVGYCPWVGVR